MWAAAAASTAVCEAVNVLYNGIIYTNAVQVLAYACVLRHNTSEHGPLSPLRLSSRLEVVELFNHS